MNFEGIDELVDQYGEQLYKFCRKLGCTKEDGVELELIPELRSSLYGKSARSNYLRRSELCCVVNSPAASCGASVYYYQAARY